ncbi:A24 family peptidase [Phycicoccus sp. SLBN-51]|uniref:prepilin peptidase n=1 Tax=Phycicoccus sp. SLBN-51 TaxID=2768447 RepID=UPI00114FD973|nr:A24 family peptidase [Phycicoccus sp. SLBN-51]TQJ51072.1 leader peptidase (prepilin peptidase)/N-methyltransferase [Phycicoccus sp. SLBN-51]
MVTFAAGAGAPAWVVAALAVLGGVLGVVTGRALGTGGYRVEADEPGSILPRAPWWPAPALALLWGFLAWRIGDLAAWAALPAYLFFAWLAVSLVWIDVDVHRLPDGLVLPAYPALLVLLACASVGAGDWRPMRDALVAMAGLYVLYFLMALASPASLGFGDVKLSGLIGLVLGWLGLGTALLGLLAGFVAGGLIAIVMLVAQRAGLRSHIAFGPAMIIGALLALAFEYQLFPA